MRRGLAVVVCVVVFAGGAWGDEATDSARTHYQRATSLYDVGRFAEAAQEYEAAYQLKNDPALLFNLGQAYRYAGDFGRAIFAYRGYLRRVPQADNRRGTGLHRQSARGARGATKHCGTPGAGIGGSDGSESQTTARRRSESR